MEKPKELPALQSSTPKPLRETESALGEGASAVPGSLNVESTPVSKHPSVALLGKDSEKGSLSSLSMPGKVAFSAVHTPSRLKLKSLSIASANAEGKGEAGDPIEQRFERIASAGSGAKDARKKESDDAFGGP